MYVANMQVCKYNNYYTLCNCYVHHLVDLRLTVDGPSEAIVGSSISIRCNVLEGYPLPSVFIINPRNQVNQSPVIFNVTLEDAGNYTCVANNSIATVTSNLLLTIYGMYDANVY